jgi:hypothetical protein
MSYRDIALPLAARGVPTIPLRERSKVAFLNQWETLATTDLQQIESWDKEYPNANGGSVAQGKLGGFWMLELDRAEALQRIESQTGQKIPLTFRVRSSPGRGHFYWKQSADSLAMGNIAQSFVVGGDWSARVDRQYVVSPGSLHPTTGLPYEVLSNPEIIEAPSWLIDFLKTQKTEKAKAILPGPDGVINEGGRNVSLASYAGKLRSTGCSYEVIELALLERNRDQCKPPLDDDDVRVIAASICRYPAGEDHVVLFHGVPAGTSAAVQQAPQPAAAVAVAVAAQVVVEPEDLPKREMVPYPVFPAWVMEGTSIYEGFVKPYCEANCRYPEFMFMPALVLLLNYIAIKVRVKHNKDLYPSIFLILIGRRGDVIKSSSVEDAIRYFEFAGVTAYAAASTSNANSMSLVFKPGSPEGLGKEMQRLKCTNVVAFYDELRALTNKAGIETSNLAQDLLTLHESGFFSNRIKGGKDSFVHNPGTYCATLIACSTDTSFPESWSSLSGEDLGLNDRTFFLYQPAVFKKRTPKVDVDFSEAAKKTRQLIEKAVKQGLYEIPDRIPLNHASDEFNTRGESRVEKFALGFAIDLGLDTIDEDCVERAMALVRYEKAVKKYLRLYEGKTREAGIQMAVEHTLLKHDGIMVTRDLQRALHSERWGTSVWSQLWNGMLREGWIREEGAGTKADPKKTRLLRKMQTEDDDA